MLTTITHFVGTDGFITCVKIFFIVAEAIIKAKMKKKKEMTEGGETEGDNHASPFLFFYSFRSLLFSLRFNYGGGYNSLINLNYFYFLLRR